MLDELIRWGTRRRDIIALIMTGSRAQPEGRVDALSDWDLEIFTTDAAIYTSGDDWMAEIGSVWVYLPTVSERGCETRLVVFEGGNKVDFSIWPLHVLQAAVDSRKLIKLYESGFRILVDKEGLAARLPPPSYSPSAPPTPTEAEFRAAVEEFWFEAFHIPKYLQRGDLWNAKSRDWTMKELLLKMIEWHAFATSDDVRSVASSGTRMKEWIRPDPWKRLHEAFARFDADDSRRALQETMSLFRDLAVATANRLSYRYPIDVDTAIARYIAKFDEPPS